MASPRHGLPNHLSPRFLRILLWRFGSRPHTHNSWRLRGHFRVRTDTRDVGPCSQPLWLKPQSAAVEVAAASDVVRTHERKQAGRIVDDPSLDTKRRNARAGRQGMRSIEVMVGGGRGRCRERLRARARERKRAHGEVKRAGNNVFSMDSNTAQTVTTSVEGYRRGEGVKGGERWSSLLC